MNIDYTLAEAGNNVQLEIYDMVGKQIANYNLGEKAKGAHSFQVSMQDDVLAKISNGMYICRIRSGETSQQVRFVLNR
jgi:flagellar hook assembly protein FlgD